MAVKLREKHPPVYLRGTLTCRDRAISLRLGGLSSYFLPLFVAQGHRQAGQPAATSTSLADDPVSSSPHILTPPLIRTPGTPATVANHGDTLNVTSPVSSKAGSLRVGVFFRKVRDIVQPTLFYFCSLRAGPVLCPLGGWTQIPRVARCRQCPGTRSFPNCLPLLLAVARHARHLLLLKRHPGRCPRAQ